MVQHIKELAEDFKANLKGKGRDVQPIVDARGLLAEIEDLQTREFAPSARREFVQVKFALKRWVEVPRLGDGSEQKLLILLDRFIAVLEHFGPLAQPPSRVFRWLNDTDLRTIIERDYIELSQLTLPNGAVKSTIVLAGSITEAILFDLITKDAVRLAQAKAHANWPRYKGGQKVGTAKSDDELSLEDLIVVATAVGLIEKHDEETFDRVLRNYRNFVHPAREIKDERECTEGRALMAKGALDALCDHFDRTLP